MTPDLFVAVLATVVSVVALVYAVMQRGDAKRTLKNINDATTQLNNAGVKLQTISSNVKAMLGEIPTRHIGGFPGSLEDVVSLLNSAQKSIRILTDFSGYGSYSAYEKFDRYVDAVKKLSRKGTDISIELCVYDRGLRSLTFEKQFPPEKYTERAFTEDKVLIEFQQRMRRHGRDVRDHASLMEALIYDENLILSQLSPLPQLIFRTVNKPAPIFLWVVDGIEVIFSFESEPGWDEHFAFRTRDGNLIRYFDHYWDTCWASGKLLRVVEP